MQNQMEKNVEKQLILRFFRPDMALLKETAKEAAAISRDVKLGLYGQSDEVLVSCTARAYASAAATELTERVAEVFEDALGDTVYGRGKSTLAHIAAGEMIEGEYFLSAADVQTGNLLAAELGATKRGAHVFDFGENSYNSAKMLARIEEESMFDDEKVSALQLASDRAVAAAKCTKSDFGAAITGLEEGTVYAAVCFKKAVYIRRIKNSAEAPKAAALSILDMIRRLLQKLDMPYSKMFRAGDAADWEAGQRKKKGSKIAAPLTVLIVLLLAFGIALWYLFTTFIIPQDDAVPVQQPQSSTVETVPESIAENTQAASDIVSSTDSSKVVDANGGVHPFG